jgi:Tfp pilus assembly protein PilF
VRQYPKRPDAYSTYGWVLYRNGKVDEAAQALKNATDLSSGNLTPDTAFYLAQVFYDRGKKAEARTLLETILKGERPFSMRPEAQELMDKLAKEPKSTDK